MHLPGPLRAAVGLAATAATEAKHLPDRAIELPMLVVSSALQASLRAQQRYARLAARGDEVLNRRTPTEEPPPWATFDEPVSLDELRRSVESGGGPLGGRSAFENLFGVEDPTLDPDGREPVDEILSPDEPPPVRPVAKAPKKGAARKTGKQAAAKKAAKSAAKAAKPARTKPTVPVNDVPVNDVPVNDVPVDDVPVDDGAFADPAVAKTVSKPRHTAPSAFDNVTDD